MLFYLRPAQDLRYELAKQGQLHQKIGRKSLLCREIPPFRILNRRQSSLLEGNRPKSNSYENPHPRPITARIWVVAMLRKQASPKFQYWDALQKRNGTHLFPA